jgi:DNA-binding NarL/FixJ family response regulator
MIVYLAADLIWATRIKATAEAIDIQARPVRTLEMLEARLADSDISAMIVDLDSPIIAIELVGRLKGHEAKETEKEIRVVAFGPHVHKELFDQARQAGADEVLTRGAFDHNLPEILLHLASRNR